MTVSVKPVEFRRWRATVGPDQRGEPDPERQEPPVSDERADQGRAYLARNPAPLAAQGFCLEDAALPAQADNTGRTRSA